MPCLQSLHVRFQFFDIAVLSFFFQPTWLIVDPICTFIFSGLVLITTIAIIRDTIVVLMEGMFITLQILNFDYFILPYQSYVHC